MTTKYSCAVVDLLATHINTNTINTTGRRRRRPRRRGAAPKECQKTESLFNDSRRRRLIIIIIQSMAANTPEPRCGRSRGIAHMNHQYLPCSSIASWKFRFHPLSCGFFHRYPRALAAFRSAENS